ncbi:MAG TPA: hypothetical protein VEP29_09545, partial [Desulfatiglandales bacterium]|nr:hypothetical protein [Desulfatiglandales bacterium]
SDLAKYTHSSRPRLDVHEHGGRLRGGGAITGASLASADDMVLIEISMSGLLVWMSDPEPRPKSGSPAPHRVFGVRIDS